MDGSIEHLNNGCFSLTVVYLSRVCVYTAGSPINNRALFPCQEPPVAMSTWQATVRAPSECLVLMSGEEQAVPIEDGDTRKLLIHKPLVTTGKSQVKFY